MKGEDLGPKNRGGEGQIIREDTNTMLLGLRR